jgi:hypothetical protein
VRFIAQVHSAVHACHMHFITYYIYYIMSCRALLANGTRSSRWLGLLDYFAAHHTRAVWWSPFAIAREGLPPSALHATPFQSCLTPRSSRTQSSFPSELAQMHSTISARGTNDMSCPNASRGSHLKTCSLGSAPSSRSKLSCESLVMAQGWLPTANWRTKTPSLSKIDTLNEEPA